MIVLAAPTGFGKTKLATMVAKDFHDNGVPWAFYTHRKMLFAQTRNRFLLEGLDHGCRASGYEDFEAKFMHGQMAMIQSERAAVESAKRELHNARLVFIDEAHNNKTGFCKTIVDHARQNDAKVLLLSATPLGLGDIADSLINLCTMSELRKIGGALSAVIKAPCEADLSKLKARAGAEFKQGDLRKTFMNHAVVGQVYENWKKFNPHGLPAILFAPDVQSSIWFVDHLRSNGVRAAHIDGAHIYYGEKSSDGEPVFESSLIQSNRDRLAEQSRTGEIQIVCNRFVLIEGVDWPWLYHGIFATSFNTETCWVQACGRVLRYWPEYDHVLITDHGGNIYRPSLGSPNEDRIWQLQHTNASRAQESKNRRERGEERTPATCPKCKSAIKAAYWQSHDKTCPTCGHKFHTPIREVIQHNGILKTFKEPTKRQQKAPASDVQKLWNNIYFPSRKSKREKSSNFNQLKARFQSQYPDMRIVERHGRTCVRTPDGLFHQIKFVPPPDSSYWSWEARRVPIQQLQGD